MAGMECGVDRLSRSKHINTMMSLKYTSLNSPNQQVGEKELIGIAHHPHRNLLVTFGDEGVLKMWRP